MPFLKNNRHARLLWIQFFKRFPYNLRRVFLVEKDYNPKGLALFLSGYCNLYKSDNKNEYLEKITFLADKIISLQSKGYSGSCWGYNFDWQARAFYKSKYTPTVVVTSFATQALLDAFDILNDKKLLEIAASACNFILRDLNRVYDGDGNFAFSYSPHDKNVIFNASFLGAKTLAKVYSYTKEDNLLKEAKRSVAFCCKHQNADGSWTYGVLPYHQWIDSFHTGYNLESLWEYENFSDDRTYRHHIEKGLNYYLKVFFTTEGIPKYYNNSTYPIDVHSAAQLIITLCKMANERSHEILINKVLHWAIENIQDEEGFFYYQFGKFLKCKISYMRWSQAWMFYALSYLIRRLGIKE